MDNIDYNKLIIKNRSIHVRGLVGDRVGAKVGWRDGCLVGAKVGLRDGLNSKYIERQRKRTQPNTMRVSNMDRTNESKRETERKKVPAASHR